MAEQKFVIIALGKERYGIPIADVQRILFSQEITRIPKSNPVCLGIFELSGRTYPVFDLGLRLDQPASQGGHDVVVRSPQGDFALRVDDVVGIVEVTDDQTEDPPATIQAKDDPFFNGVAQVEGDLVVLLVPNGIVPERLRPEAELVA